MRPRHSKRQNTYDWIAEHPGLFQRIKRNAKADFYQGIKPVSIKDCLDKAIWNSHQMVELSTEEINDLADVINIECPYIQFSKRKMVS